MVKSQDVVVLLKLAGEPNDWTFERVAEQLGLSASAVHRSLERAGQAGLYDSPRRSVRRAQLLEFLAHGAKYVFPAVMRGEARGIPTAWAAPPLSSLLVQSGSNIPVWPHHLGKVRGLALEPLHSIVPEAALGDPRLGELLALFDAIRLGPARDRNLAIEELADRLGSAPQLAV